MNSVCGGLRGAFLSHFPPYMWRYGLSLESKLIGLACLAGQPAPETFGLCLPSCGVTGCPLLLPSVHMGSYACAADALLSKSLPSALLVTFLPSLSLREKLKSPATVVFVSFFFLIVCPLCLCLHTWLALPCLLGLTVLLFYDVLGNSPHSDVCLSAISIATLSSL